MIRFFIIIFLFFTSCIDGSNLRPCKLEVTYQNGDIDTLVIKCSDFNSPYIDKGDLRINGANYVFKSGVREFKILN